MMHGPDLIREESLPDPISKKFSNLFALTVSSLTVIAITPSIEIAGSRLRRSGFWRMTVRTDDVVKLKSVSEDLLLSVERD